MSSDEVTVSSVPGIGKYIAQAAEIIERSGTVTITAINSGIPNAVNLVESLKHKIKGLHQLNSLENVPDSNKVRTTFKLSLNPLNQQDPGYQEPLQLDQIQEKTFEELKIIPRRPEGERPYGERRPQRTSRRGSRGGFRDFRGARGNFRGPRGSRGFRDPRGSRGSRGLREGSSEGARGGASNFRDSRSFRGSRRAGGGARDFRPKVSERTIPGPADILVNFRAPPVVFRKQVLEKFSTGADQIFLKGSGQTIPKTVRVAEEVKRNEFGLHQIMSYSMREISMEGEGESRKRKVIGVEIILSKTPLDVGNPGYQPPLPDSEVTRLTEEELKAL